MGSACWITQMRITRPLRGLGKAIQGQVHQMSRLLDDLLDVARITQGKIDFRKQVLDLNDLIAEAVQVVQPAMEARRQRLSVIPALGPVMVEGDPTRLLQIVENLLTNASKYTPSEGAITLELKKRAMTACCACETTAGALIRICWTRSLTCFFSPTRRSIAAMGGWVSD